MLSPSPRHFLPDATLPGAGLPSNRAARLRARGAFVDLKRGFIEAASGLGGGNSNWLRRQIHHAEEPVDLWLLRGALLHALSGPAPEHREARLLLHRCLERLFPDGGPTSGGFDSTSPSSWPLSDF
jgi:hypothetical protein